MPETTLGLALCDIRGPLADLNEKLGGSDGRTWLGELNRFLRKEPCWIANCAENSLPAQPELAVLEFVCAIETPATTSNFVSKDMFLPKTRRGAPVQIKTIFENFYTYFFSENGKPGAGKIEKPIRAQKIACHNLVRVVRDAAIIRELGYQDYKDDDEKVETTLTEMYFLLQRQGMGEDGVLLTNGKANVFYIPDATKELRTVSTRWRGTGWTLNAHVVNHSSGWDWGTRIFTRGPKDEVAKAAVAA